MEILDSSKGTGGMGGEDLHLASRVSHLPRNELLAALQGVIQQFKGSADVISAIDSEVKKVEAVRSKMDQNAKVGSAKQQKQKARKVKEFDMSKYAQRHVAIQLQYDGSKYYGFASQKDECEETVEKYLFEALLKLRLIESRASCNYSRCGRTDKGVSAMRQVVAFNLRSNLPKDATEEEKASVTEVDYCNLLNKSFPPEIRALGVSFVSPDFSARFSATYRTYRYFFVRRNLKTDAMLAAAKSFIGVHDFRNFCKLDAPNVTNFEREVLFVNLVCYRESPDDKTHDMMYLEISGLAFLWHMVRCIMAVLFLVGKELESPSIVCRLLDVSVEPTKPEYPLAADAPLLLYDCGFKNTSFNYSPRVLKFLEAHYEEQWEQNSIAAARAKTSLDWIQGCPVQKEDVNEVLQYMFDQRKKKKPGAAFITFQACGDILAADIEKNEDEQPVSKRQKLDPAEDEERVVAWGRIKSHIMDDNIANYKPLLEVIYSTPT